MKTISLLIISFAYFDFAICGVCPVSTATVRSVSRCPATKEEWDEAARRKKCEMMADTKYCDMPPVYHCLLNQWRNETLEVCASPWYISGFCAIYDTDGMKVGDDFSRDCTNFTVGKCLSRYHSPEAYKYQKCYEKILDSLLSETNPVQQTSEGSGNTFLVLAIVILFVITVFLVLVLFRKQLRKLQKRVCSDWSWLSNSRENDLENQEGQEEVNPFLNRRDTYLTSGNDPREEPRQENAKSVETKKDSYSPRPCHDPKSEAGQQNTESNNETRIENKSIRYQDAKSIFETNGENGKQTQRKKETSQQSTEDDGRSKTDSGVYNAEDKQQQESAKNSDFAPDMDLEYKENVILSEEAGNSDDASNLVSKEEIAQKPEKEENSDRVPNSVSKQEEIEQSSEETGTVDTVSNPDLNQEDTIEGSTEKKEDSSFKKHLHYFQANAKLQEN